MIQIVNKQFIKTLCIIIILFLFTAHSLWAKITIMPLGDSITLGIGPSDLPENLNGYRRDLYNLLSSSGYDIDFVGSLSNGTFVEKQHEGHPGATAADIASSLTGVYSRLVAYPADIILLHIGTNGLSEDPNQVETILYEVARWERDNSRTVIVILARIINRSCITDPQPCPESVTTTKFNNNVASHGSSADQLRRPHPHSCNGERCRYRLSLKFPSAI